MTKILVVEDQPMFQAVYRSVLEKRGWHVIPAYDGEEGLKLAKQHHPQVILLDLMLPKVDGIGFLKAYNAPSRPETKVIILSNAAAPEIEEAAFNLGAFRYLIKAVYFTPKKLLGIVDEALATHQPAAHHVSNRQTSTNRA